MNKTTREYIAACAGHHAVQRAFVKYLFECHRLSASDPDFSTWKYLYHSRVPNFIRKKMFGYTAAEYEAVKDAVTDDDFCTATSKFDNNCIARDPNAIEALIKLIKRELLRKI